MAVFIEDIGVTITLQTGIDISFATSYEIHVKKPNGKQVIWTAVQSSTENISYNIVTGDLNISGDYILQAYVSDATTKLHGAKTTLTVERHH